MGLQWVIGFYMGLQWVIFCYWRAHTRRFFLKVGFLGNLNDPINPDIEKNFAETVVYKNQPKKLKF